MSNCSAYCTSLRAAKYARTVREFHVCAHSYNSVLRVLFTRVLLCNTVMQKARSVIPSAARDLDHGACDSAPWPRSLVASMTYVLLLKPCQAKLVERKRDEI